jgi:hypothetical protein
MLVAVRSADDRLDEHHFDLGVMARALLLVVASTPRTTLERSRSRQCRCA